MIITIHISVFDAMVIVKKSSPKNLSADRLRKKKNCVKNEQLTWHNNP